MDTRSGGTGATTLSMPRKVLAVALSVILVMGLSPFAKISNRAYAQEVTTGSSGSLTTQEVSDTDVAKIGETGYATLAGAVEAASAGDTVTLLADTSASFTVAKDLTLDLGEKTLTVDTQAGFKSTSGMLTVQNGSLRSSETDFITAEGGVVVLKGTADMPLKVSGSSSIIDVSGNGKVIVDGAEVTCSDNVNRYAALFVKNGVIEVKAGNVEHLYSNAVSVSAGGKLVVSGGEISGKSSYTTVMLKNGGELEMSGGKISSASWTALQVGVSGMGAGKASISGGLVETKAVSPAFVGVYTENGGSLEVTGGEVSSEHTAALTASGSADSVISGGKLSSGSESFTAGVYGNGMGVLRVSGGEIVNTGSGAALMSGSAGYGSKGKLEITGGKVGSASGKAVLLGYEGSDISISGGEFSDDSAKAFLTDSYAVHASGDESYPYKVEVASDEWIFEPISSGSTQSGDTISFTGSTVAYDAANNSNGRLWVSAWLGAKVIAPESVTESNLGAVKYDRAGNANIARTVGDDAATGKLLANGKDGIGADGRYYMEVWVPLSAQSIRKALSENQHKIYRTYTFYTMDDKTDSKAFTLEVDIDNITLVNSKNVEGELAEPIEVVGGKEQLTVTFDADNGQDSSVVKVSKGDPVARPATDPTKEGYTFKGWQLDGVAYNFESAVDASITLTAAWEEKADPVAMIGETGYATPQAAVDAAASGETVKLVGDISSASALTIPAGKDVVLDLNGHKLVATGGVDAVFNAGTLKVQDSADSGLIQSEGGNGIGCGSNSVTTVESGTVKAQECAVCTFKTTSGATVNIKGGSLETVDNSVVSSNGTPGANGNTFNITGGTFTGNITSAGYVACGVYAPNDDTFNITGGVFTINGGAGIVARAGAVNLSGDVVITTTGNATGKVGDSRVVVPCSALVFDSTADYPGLKEASKISVSGGKFSSQASVVHAVDASDVSRFAISGGLFSDETAKAFLADDKVLLDNTDAATSGTYKYVVGEQSEASIQDAVAKKDTFATEYGADGTVTWNTLFRAMLAYDQVKSLTDDRVKDLTAYYTGLDKISLADDDITKSIYTGTDAGALANLTGLKEVDLSGTGIADVVDESGAVTEGALGSLTALTALESLNVSGNVGLVDFGALAQISSLKTLNVSGTGFGDNSFGGIVGLPLTSLDLSNTDVSAIGPITTNGSSPAIANTLTTLDVSNTKLAQLQEVWNGTTQSASLPALKTLKASGLTFANRAISGLVMIAAKQDFSADGLTWDLTGSTLNADTDNHVGQIKAGFASYEGFKAPTVTVPAPVAKTDLVYNGSTQTGVEPGKGYSNFVGYDLGGHEGTGATSYTAIATLWAGYEWIGETGNSAMTEKTVPWSIAPKSIEDYQVSVEPETAEEGADAPTVTVKLGDDTLDAKNYDVKYVASDDTEYAEAAVLAPGEYTVKATGKGNFGGDAKTAIYTVTAANKALESFIADAKDAADVYSDAHYNKHNDGDSVTTAESFYVKATNGAGLSEDLGSIKVNEVELKAEDKLKLSVGNNAFAEGTYYKVKGGELYLAFPVALFDMTGSNDSIVEAGDLKLTYKAVDGGTATVKSVTSSGNGIKVSDEGENTYKLAFSQRVASTTYTPVTIDSLETTTLAITKKVLNNAKGTSTTYGMTYPDAEEQIFLYPFGWNKNVAPAAINDGGSMDYQAYLVGKGKTATIKLKYEKADGGFNVTFVDTDGDTAIEAQTVPYGSKATEPTEEPKRDEFKFKGWFVSDATENYNFETPVTSDLTLKAHWEAVEYGVKVAETENGSVTVDLEKAAKGDIVTVTTNPKEGYALDTLTVTDKYGKPVVVTDEGEFTMPSGDVTVKATFKAEKTSIAAATVTVDETFTYTGLDQTDAAKLAVQVKLGETDITAFCDIAFDDGKTHTAEEGHEVAVKDAGTYKVKVTAKVGSDYTGSAKDGELEVAKATLIATYAGEEIEFGAKPRYAVSVEGFVNGEDAKAAANYKAPVVKGPDTIEAGRTYPLTPEGGSADNYNFEYKGGNLIVKALPEPVKLGEAVAAPLVDHSTEPGTAVDAGFEVTDQSYDDDKRVYSVKLAADALPQHVNAAGQAAYWFGVGIPVGTEEGLDGYEVATGYGKDTATDQMVFTSERTSWDGENSTFYFGWGPNGDYKDDPSSYRSQGAYVALKDTQENVTVYRMDLTDLKFDFTIAVAATENGAVEVDTHAVEGTEVTVTVKPAEGYELDTLAVKDASGANVAVNVGKFLMPAKPVTVTATFKEAKAPEPALPETLAYEGDKVTFVKADLENAFGMLSNPSGDMAVELSDGRVHVTYTPSNSKTYAGFYLNAGYKSPSTWVADNYVKLVEGLTNDGKYDFTIDASNCGKAVPVAPVKVSNKTASTSDQYYLAIPAAEKFSQEADYAKVDAAIAKVPADLDASYTAASAAKVTAAVSAVVRDKKLPEQAAVDVMASTIETALADLVPIVSIADAEVELSHDYAAVGEVTDPDVTLYVGDAELRGDIFTVKYKNASGDVLETMEGQSIGEYTVVIAADKEYKGVYYTGEATAEFEITKKLVNGMKVVNHATKAGRTYTGSQITPSVTVYQADGTLLAPENYTVVYGTNVDAGEGAGRIIVTGKGDYSGFIISSFDIEPRTITKDMISASGAKYTGKAVNAVTVKYNGKKLVEGVDYAVGYENNVEPGTATASVVGLYDESAAVPGNFTGFKSVQFTIAKAASTLKTANKSASLNYNAAKKAYTAAQAFGVSGGTKVTYAKSGTWDKNVTLNTSTGAVTVKKGIAAKKYTLKATVTDAGDSHYEAASKTVTFTLTVNQIANTFTLKLNPKQLSAKSSKGAKFTNYKKWLTVSKNVGGALTFKATVPAKVKKYITVNGKTGQVVVAKKCPTGVYKIPVKVTSAAKGNYKETTKQVTLNVKVTK